MVLKNLFAEQQWRCRRREEPYGRRPGRVEEGEGEMNIEELQAYTPPYLKWTANGNFLCDSGAL